MLRKSMQISVKLHCNQSCKSHRFSIWASSFLCTCFENGVRGRWVKFRKTETAEKGKGKKDDKQSVWQEGGDEKHSKKHWFWTHSFLLDSDLKIHTMIKIVQQCETSSAQALCLFFVEKKGEAGEKESDEKGRWMCRFVWALFTTEHLQCSRLM